jgi:hypothetical protein
VKVIPRRDEVARGGEGPGGRSKVRDPPRCFCVSLLKIHSARVVYKQRLKPVMGNDGR